MTSKFHVGCALCSLPRTLNPHIPTEVSGVGVAARVTWNKARASHSRLQLLVLGMDSADRPKAQWWHGEVPHPSPFCAPLPATQHKELTWGASPGEPQGGRAVLGCNRGVSQRGV